jgi:hypothetical protein
MQTALSEPFSSSELSIMRGYFMDNINIEGKGGIAAAPKSSDTLAGSYYYHWMRDGKLYFMKEFALENAIKFSTFQAHDS